MVGKPPVPPSISEGTKEKSDTNFFVTMLKAFKNPYFVLFLIVGGKAKMFFCELKAMLRHSLKLAVWI